MLESALHSVPNRGWINRAGGLGRKDDGDGGDDEDGADHHHEAVSRQHQALARHEVVEHLVYELAALTQIAGQRTGLATWIGHIGQFGVSDDAAVLPGGRYQ